MGANMGRGSQKVVITFNHADHFARIREFMLLINPSAEQMEERLGLTLRFEICELPGGPQKLICVPPKSLFGMFPTPKLVGWRKH